MKFSILKISWFVSYAVNFLKTVERNWGQIKKISEKLKKFGVSPDTNLENKVLSFF